MLIRDAQAADLVDLARLAADTFPLACPPGMPRADIEAFIAEHLSEPALAAAVCDPHSGLLVAVLNSEILGYALVYIEQNEACLSKCYVHPQAHGSGLATELLASAVSWARTHQATRMQLGVNQHNSRAQRFYLKHGFQRVGVRQFTVGTSVEDDFVLELRLGVDAVG